MAAYVTWALAELSSDLRTEVGMLLLLHPNQKENNLPSGKTPHEVATEFLSDAFLFYIYYITVISSFIFTPD